MFQTEPILSKNQLEELRSAINRLKENPIDVLEIKLCKGIMHRINAIGVTNSLINTKRFLNKYILLEEEKQILTYKECIEKVETQSILNDYFYSKYNHFNRIKKIDNIIVRSKERYNLYINDAGESNE